MVAASEGGTAVTQAARPSRPGLAAIGLVFALVLPSLGLPLYLARIPGMPPLVAQEGFWWALLAIVLFFVLAVERRGLKSIGWRRPDWRTLAFGVGGAAAAMAGGALMIVLVLPRLGLHQDAGALQRMLANPFWLRVAIVTRAAIFEEVSIRGYGIERVQELTGSKWIAGAVTLAVFSFAHLSHWGVAQVLVAGAVGLPLTVLYIWRRDLAANILAHWIVDGISVLLVG